jgi:aminoglycoside 2''-phosphotransferase
VTEFSAQDGDRLRIAALAPDLVIETIRRDNGQFNDVLIVNDAWVFRFAKSEAALAALPGEEAFLRAVAGRLPIATPEVQYISLEPPHAGMGYSALPGVALSREWLATAPELALQRIGTRLGEFLLTLHTLSLDLFAGIVIQDRADEWAELYGNIRERLFPHMRPDARAEVAARFDAFLAAGGGGWAAAPRHGDFGSGNVLHDADTHGVVGVIDFGSAALGDPAVDIAALATMGDQVYRAALAVYPEAAAYEERASFYRSTFALQQAWYGLRDGSWEDFEHGIARYR